MDPTLALMFKDPNNAKKLMEGIRFAVQRSYDVDMIRDGEGRAITTQHEIKRRVGICIDLAKQLRTDAFWSVFRISDAMPILLRRKLDGLDCDPTTLGARMSWFPDHLSKRAC